MEEGQFYKDGQSVLLKDGNMEEPFRIFIPVYEKYSSPQLSLNNSAGSLVKIYLIGSDFITKVGFFTLWWEFGGFDSIRPTGIGADEVYLQTVQLGG